MNYKRQKKIELCPMCNNIADHNSTYCWPDDPWEDQFGYDCCGIYECCGNGPLSVALEVEIFNAIGVHQKWSHDKQLKVLQDKKLKAKYLLLI